MRMTGPALTTSPPGAGSTEPPAATRPA
ncbi:MAG: hypothetical protein AVDCRST_MAG64-2952, partial [uncultured Phycisphaerae bacterium]